MAKGTGTPCSLVCKHMRADYDCKRFGCDHHAVDCPNAPSFEDEDDDE